MDSLLNESRPLTPIICFLSMGSDPIHNIEYLAKKNSLRCKSISMGQGQEIHAKKFIAQAISEVYLNSSH